MRQCTELFSVGLYLFCYEKKMVPFLHCDFNSINNLKNAKPQFLSHLN